MPDKRQKSPVCVRLTSRRPFSGHVNSLEGHPRHKRSYLRSLFSGYPYRILEAWNNDKLILIVSKEILDEYGRIGRMLADQFPLINFEPMLKFVMTNAVIVKPGKLRQPVCDDPDDDKFFACGALAG